MSFDTKLCTKLFVIFHPIANFLSYVPQFLNAKLNAITLLLRLIRQYFMICMFNELLDIILIDS